jgi:hypothetical protein
VSWVVPGAWMSRTYWDGDTVDVGAIWQVKVAEPFGQSPAIHTKPLAFRVRLPGINAASLPTTAGKSAAAFVFDWCTRAPFDVTSDGSHYKFGGPRYSAYAQFMGDLVRGGEKLTDALLDHLLAVYWDGTGPRPAEGH